MCCNTLFFTITEENLPKQVDDLGSQFTEIFIKQQENVTLLLTLVEVTGSHLEYRGTRSAVRGDYLIGSSYGFVFLVNPCQM